MNSGQFTIGDDSGRGPLKPGTEIGSYRIESPRGNQKDLRDLPEDVRKEMEFIFADRVRDVLADMLPGVVPSAAPKAA